MAKATGVFGATLNGEWLKTAYLVPVPPSKAKSHPEYDDRMLKICQGIVAGGVKATVREMVVQTTSMDAAHLSGNRPTVSDLISQYQIVENECQPTPTAIGIVDDVLTAGTHYRAMHTVLSQRFPGIPIIGLFLARRIFPETAQTDFGHLFE